MDERTIKVAAGWIYKRKDAPDWWTPLVLTKVNPDRSAPHYDSQDAFRIFDALKDKGFLKNDGEVDLPDGKKLPRFKIKWANIREFKSFAALSWADRYLPESLLKFWISWKTYLVVAGTFVVSVFSTNIFGKVSEDVYAWLKTLWN